MRLILFIFFLSAGMLVQAQIGQPVFSGQGCSGSKTFVSDKLNHYVIGVHVAVAKMIAPTISRKSCAFRLPVKLKANEKLIIADVQHDVKLSAGRGVHIKSNLDFFLVGQKSQSLSAQAKGVVDSVEVSESVKSTGPAIESVCGNDAIIAGNVSVSIAGAGRGTASTSPIAATLKISSCN